LLPFGAEPTGHAWLHSRCWDAWHTGRKSEAGHHQKPDFGMAKIDDASFRTRGALYVAVTN
jgi:hypothetical protein